MDNLKEIFDDLVKKYDTKNFINSDPVQFIHKYNNLQDIEIAGIIASSLAYGKREAFIEKLKYIFEIFNGHPYNFCLNLEKNFCEEYFSNFKYRFNTGDDICLLLKRLHEFYNEHNSFDDFLKNQNFEQKSKAKQVVGRLSETLCKNIERKSYCYLFPHPKSNSACKRLNLLLKWLIRKSEVDKGIWKVIDPKDLIIPLDTHVATVARKLNLTQRKSNDWQTAEEITSKLREFDKNDPIKYDFALFDIGIDKINIQ